MIVKPIMVVAVVIVSVVCFGIGFYLFYEPKADLWIMNPEDISGEFEVCVNGETIYSGYVVSDVHIDIIKRPDCVESGDRVEVFINGVEPHYLNPVPLGDVGCLVIHPNVGDVAVLRVASYEGVVSAIIDYGQ